MALRLTWAAVLVVLGSCTVSSGDEGPAGGGHGSQVTCRDLNDCDEWGACTDAGSCAYSGYTEVCWSNGTIGAQKGLCNYVGLCCIVTSVEDCLASEECTKYGRCNFNPAGYCE